MFTRSVEPAPLSTGIPIAAASAGAAQNARSIIRSPTDSPRRIAAQVAHCIITGRNVSVRGWRIQVVVNGTVSVARKDRRPWVRQNELMGDEALRTSDVTDSDDVSFDPWPSTAQVHVEWGAPGALLAARRGDLVVVVDVLSFSTSVVEVAARDGVAFCYSPEELDDAGGRERVGRAHDAIVLSKHRRCRRR